MSDASLDSYKSAFEGPAYSVAEPQHSIASSGSIASNHSMYSMFSSDSVGSRKEGRQWKKRGLFASESPHCFQEPTQYVKLQLNESPPATQLRPASTVPVTPGATSRETFLPEFQPSAFGLQSLVKLDRNDKYFCTWPGCFKKFRFRFEWTRHEEAVHYHSFHWICCGIEDSVCPPAFGKPFENPVQVVYPECFGCNEKDVTSDHIARQHFIQCYGKERVKREFYRRDHFEKHVLRSHSFAGPLPEQVVDSWKVPNIERYDLSLQRGFCDERLDNWHARQRHVSAHMTSGAGRIHWQSRCPCRTCRKRLTLGLGHQCDRCVLAE